MKDCFASFTDVERELLPFELEYLKYKHPSEVYATLQSQLFECVVSHFYIFKDTVAEIREFDEYQMLGDMGCFMDLFETDMVIFYANEIERKFSHMPDVMQTLEMAKARYIDDLYYKLKTEGVVCYG